MACACASPAPPPATTAPPADGAPTKPGSAGLDRRHFGPAATFGQLVAAAGELEARAVDGMGSCILARRDDGFRLEAELMAGVTPLPPAPVQIAPAADSSGVQLLSRWGRMGPADAPLSLVAFTSTPPRPVGSAAAVVLVASGATWVRFTDAGKDAEGPLTPQALEALLSQHASQRPLDVFVTADSQLPLSAFYDVLAALPAGLAVGLAVALPPGTKLPGANPPRSTGHRCPDGLPEPEHDAPEGELPSAAVVAALDPLRAAAERCLAQAVGPAAAGGRVVLALRIAQSGRPSHSCLVEDPMGDPVLGACITESARSVLFPRPTPAGFVDVHIPLQLSPKWPPPPRPTCPTPDT